MSIRPAVKAPQLAQLFVLAAAVAALALLAPPAPAQQHKDFLTQLEADKIRDAGAIPGYRIKLFLDFAADRLKKFQYELSRPSQDRQRTLRLNRLLEAYTGCVDDAVELLELGRKKQEDIAQAIKYAQGKTKELLAEINKLQPNADDSYKEALHTAIESTQDAVAEADRAAKEIAPPPVRRKQ